MTDIIAALTDRDEKTAYEAAKRLAAASEASPEYYPRLGEFASLLTHKSSYVRTRAFILCCSQARWDGEGRLAELLPELLRLLHDPKPTVVRQCLKAVREIIVFRPELSETIGRELDEIDIFRYRESMTPLILKDIREVRELLEEKERE